MTIDQSQPQSQLSRFMALILRHRADEFGVRLDSHGYVRIEELLQAIQSNPRWRHITEDDILEVLRRQEKPRFEIRGDRIRARYGHSLPFRIEYDEVDPPEYLYYSANSASLGRIRVEGLLPMERQYVHLSATEDAAYQVGLRRGQPPVILRVRAREARRSGIPFHQAEELIYLVKRLPRQFLDIIDESSTPQPL